MIEPMYLLWPMALPVLAAGAMALLGRWPNARDAVALLAGVMVFGIVLAGFEPVLHGARPELQLWQIAPGLTIKFVLEPLGMLFLLLASLLWPIATVYSIGYMRGNSESNQTRFFAFFALSLAATFGIALAGNLLTLFVFYELLTLLTFPLVTHAGNSAARAGGRTYLGILMGSSVLLFLPAIVWIHFAAGHTDFVAGGILAGHVSETGAALLLLLCVLGVGKAAVMPMHRWLPAAMVAPTPVSALLHAVAVVKAGVFTVTKLVIYTFGTEFLASIPAERLMVYLAGFTVIAASAVALRQDNIKRLLAYSTIGQLSYIVLAALVLTPLSEIGAAVHIVAHGFGKITLFFVAGAIYVTAKKTEVSQLDGIGHRMPWTMTAFAVGALSMIGVPPTAGFVSKWYMIAGAFQNDLYFVLGVLVISTALNAAYFLPIIHRAFLRPENVPPKREHGEAAWPMAAALVTTATLTIALFVFYGTLVALEKSLVNLP